MTYVPLTGSLSSIKIMTTQHKNHIAIVWMERKHKHLSIPRRRFQATLMHQKP